MKPRVSCATQLLRLALTTGLANSVPLAVLAADAQASTPPSDPIIHGLASTRDGKLRLETAVPETQLYSVQSSADLARWRRVASAGPIHAANASVEIDPPATASAFYRLARESGMFRFGPRHAGVCETEGIAGTPQLKWKFKTGRGIFSSPIVVGGVVYIGSLDTNFYALDAESGMEKWRFTAGGPIRSTAAVVDGTVYLYSRDGLVRALTAANGQELWAARIAATNQVASFDNWEYFDSSPAVAGKTLYIGSGDKKLYALDLKTGNPLWTFAVKSKVSSPPAVADGRVYFGVTDGNFYALDAATGSNLWKFKTQGNPNNGYPNGDVLHAPVALGSQVFFGSRDSAVYALDAVTGKKLWRTPIMGGNNWAANSPAVCDGTLLIGSSITGALIALDTATGKQKWQLATYGGLAEYSSPAVAEGVAYFGIGDVQAPSAATALPKATPGYLQAVDLATHKEKWRFRVDGHVWSSPAVVEGVVFFGCLDGCVYALH